MATSSAGEPSTSSGGHDRSPAGDAPKWTRSEKILVQNDTPVEPYLSFTVGPRPFHQLTIEIWSHDQGWCDDGYADKDPYANSHTWFALGVIPGTNPPTTNTPHEQQLYEIQRNVRAQARLRCHRLTWRLNNPCEGEGKDVHRWLQSISHVPGTRIGVYPLAEYLGWANFVYQITVQLHSGTSANTPLHPRESPTSSRAEKGKARATEAPESPAIARSLDLPIDPQALFDVSKGLKSQFDGIFDLKFLDIAIQAMQQTISMIPQENASELAQCWSNLGGFMIFRNHKTGLKEDLSKAKEAFMEAINAVPLSDASQPRFVVELAGCLATQFVQTGDAGGLSKAIEMAEQVMETTSPDSKDYLLLFRGIGAMSGIKYEQSGEMSDLIKATDMINKAIEAAPEDARNSGDLHNLALCIGFRFERTKSMDDLNQAIKIAREAAAAASPEVELILPTILRTLGVLLKHKAARTKVVGDIEEASSAAQQAVKATPKGHAAYALNWETFANMQLYLYFFLGDAKALDAALGGIAEALRETPTDHINYPKYCATAGGLMQLKCKMTGSVDGLEEAQQILETAIENTPENHPELCLRLGSLSLVHKTRFELQRSFDDRNSQLSLLERGFACSNSPPSHRMMSAVDAAMIYASESAWDSASKMFRGAVSLLPTIGSRAVHDNDMQSLLNPAGGIATAAAAAALYAREDPSDILSLLELGRSILAGLVIDMRQDISNIRQAHPALADKFTALRDQLDSPLHGSASIGLRSLGDPLHHRRHQAAEEFKDLIQEIRQHSGFHDFLLPPTASALIAASDPNPTIVINISVYRCDAFLIAKGTIRVLELPDLTLEEVLERVTNIDRWKNYPQNLLKWLWDSICRPCLDALGFTHPVDDDEWPHIWWIPTGPLSGLPLHAAGIHTQGSRETVLDRVISSYASSIKALLHGRQHHAKGATKASGGDSAVLVAMSKTPGLEHRPLPNAKKEVDELQDLITQLGLAPMNPRSEKEDVLKHLQACKVFHFAGHGESKADPSQSLILLEDWETDPLTVKNLQGHWVRQNPPFLAYLSACSTGTNPDESLSDEGTHLVSALQLAGFRHVIGTLWEVSDRYCLEVAKVVYETLRDEGMSDTAVSRGLHKALRKLRDGVLGGAGNRDTDDAENEEEEEEQEEEMSGDSELADAHEDAREAKRKNTTRRAGANTYWIPYVHFGV